MKLSLIVPCFNEAQSLHNFYAQICATLGTLARTYPTLESELIFINDGSKDSTLAVLRDMERAHRAAFGGLESRDSILPLESTFKENTSTPPPLKAQ